MNQTCSSFTPWVLWPFSRRSTAHHRATTTTDSMTTPRTVTVTAVLMTLASLLVPGLAVAQINRGVTIECPTNVVVECATPQETAVTFAPTAQTICGTGVQISCTPASGSVFPPGTNAVTCLALDNTGSSARCGFSVIVLDTTAPVITASPVTTNCTGPLGAQVEFTVSASDNCDPQPQISCTPPSGGLFLIGTTPVQCVATDAAGNSATNRFSVEVSGDCPANCLQIHCPTNIAMTLGKFLPVVLGEAFPGTYVDYTVTATNTCIGTNLLVECTPSSGSLFKVGTHPVSCTALDGGFRKGCSFQVTVRDVTAPELSISGRTSSLYVPCKETLGDGTKGAYVTFTVKATDNVDPNPTVTCTPPSGAFFPLGTNKVVCVAKDDSGNTATNAFFVKVYPSLGCALMTLEEMSDNWGFELGLTAWEAEGDAFADQPVEGDVMKVERIAELKQQMEDKIGGDYWHELEYPAGHKGNHWVGTAENVNSYGVFFDNLGTEQRTGTLRSKSFIIEKTYLSFLIGGTEDHEKLRVELLTQVDSPAPDTVTYAGLHYKVRYHRTGHNREVMRWENWELNIYKGKRALIRIIDQSGTGHLNVDDFRFEDSAPAYQVVKIAGKEYPAGVTHDGEFYHWDSPVWGFADLHTHPMSYLGFGGFVMHGEPDGDITTALRNCRCSHGGHGTDNECGDYMRQAVIAMTDSRGPSPHYNDYNDYHPDNPIAEFNSWPLFSSKLHQQMWHEWMRRAYDGGQRVVVALGVNNPLLAVGTKGTLPHDDLSVGVNQIQALTDFVQRHSDFMEIALDPFQLRDIVRRNKLAIIIGSELDDIGNFAKNNSVNAMNPSEGDKDKVRAEIQGLYNLGLRYMFPVHLVNNKFGGTAIAGDMLNVANKYQNHEAFQVESNANLYLGEDPNEVVGLYLHHLDFTDELLSAFKPWELLDKIVNALDKTEEKFGAAIGFQAGLGFYPLALVAASGLLAIVEIETGANGIPDEIIPLNGHYPAYPEKDTWAHGHRNAKGLTPLGEFAIGEMMKLGILIDIDHLSEKAVAQVLAMAEKNPVGYPLNSGHNSPRVLGLEHERGENSRTLNQIERVRDLGGIFGVGFENGRSHAFDDHWKTNEFTHSQIENDCAGTSKTFAQYYLYTVEAMRGRGVAFGTDINGLIAGPGPRFGPQSAFGLGGTEAGYWRAYEINAQENGVRYDPEYEVRPLATPAFIGNAIDTGVEFYAPRTHLGYAYNIEQGDFFAAIRIYYWLKDEIEDGKDEDWMLAKLQQAVEALHSGYPNHGRVWRYAEGLLRGIHDWPVTGDLNNETAVLQNLGKNVYRSEVNGEVLSLEITSGDERYKRAVTVWHRYHAAFGQNTPLKPCQTGYKQWDINFEGVAHYGLLPDFLQDLHNVGMHPEDMSVLFKSAEHFAQMWTKALQASWAMVPQFTEFKPEPGNGLFGILLTFTTDGGDYEIEESDDLDPRGWRPASVEEISSRGNLRTMRVIRSGPTKFYRLRKR